MTAPIVTPYAQLEIAFALSGSAGSEYQCYIDPRDGAVYCFDCFGESLDEVPEDFDRDTALCLPDKYELDLGTQLVFDFIAQQAPEHHDRVSTFFQRKGAYRRYKDWLFEVGLEQDWYAFEARRTREALHQWCSDNGVQLKD